jgi:ribokinase
VHLHLILSGAANPDREDEASAVILVFGSINVDLVVPVRHLPRAGETVLGPAYSVVAGGKGANQALAARRAGSQVRMAGATGTDGFADTALALLRSGGVDLSRVRATQSPTGAAFIAVDAQGGNLIIVASGANCGARQADLPDDWLNRDTLVVLQMEVPVRENWALVERARRAGARLLLNCAPSGDVPESALASLDWLVVNESEAVDIARSRKLDGSDPVVAARALASAGQVTVIVTLGDQGARAFLPGGGGWRVGTLPITPVDTTGAGDAFVGAFAAAIDRGQDLPSALRYGSVAGGLACTLAGAQPSLPMQAAIEGRLAELPPAAKS